MSNSRHPNGRIKIERPVIQSREDEELWRQVARFVELIPHEPEPNMGRLDEIKEEIRKGTYITPDVIEETSARLAIRFMRKE